MGHTFLITGGAGFVGTNLARHLLKNGASVRTLDLAPCASEELGGRVHHIQGDLRDRARLRDATKGVDVVVHAGAALPLWAPEEIHSINVDGTAAVLETSAELGVRRVVMISTTAVYGMPDREDLSEEAPLAGVDPYARSKILAETVAAGFRRRLCVPILRAKLVVGPGRLGIFDVIFDWVARGKHVPIIGPGENRYQMLHVEDLSEAIWLASTRHAEVAGDTFNIAAAEFDTVCRDYQGLLDHAGFGRRVVALPSGALLPLLRTLSKLNLSPLSQDILNAAGKKSSVLIDKAGRLLAWTPRYSNLDALIAAYEWYVAHREEFRGKEGVTHRNSLNQGVLSIVRAFF
jgi:nucleoside-diphosphate-sugar epimerase